MYRSVLPRILIYGSECAVWQEKCDSREKSIELIALRIVPGVSLTRAAQKDAHDVPSLSYNLAYSRQQPVSTLRRLEKLFHHMMA